MARRRAPNREKDQKCLLPPYGLQIHGTDLGSATGTDGRRAVFYDLPSLHLHLFENRNPRAPLVSSRRFVSFRRGDLLTDEAWHLAGWW
jgi:hypothetical protein